jgi:phosphoesterase RecJ-like protein
MEAGVSPPAVARSIFDSNNLGRLKLFGAVLSRMQLDPTGRIAMVYVDQQLASECGGTYEDTEGLINLPLTVKEILSVVFFKESGPNDWRVSMRSKGDIDVNAVAKEFGGGGHKNASGCSAAGSLSELKTLFQRKLTDAIARAVRVS